jgi:hypothetical protein
MRNKDRPARRKFSHFLTNSHVLWRRSRTDCSLPISLSRKTCVPTLFPRLTIPTFDLVKNDDGYMPKFEYDVTPYI